MQSTCGTKRARAKVSQSRITTSSLVIRTSSSSATTSKLSMIIIMSDSSIATVADQLQPIESPWLPRSCSKRTGPKSMAAATDTHGTLRPAVPAAIITLYYGRVADVPRLCNHLTFLRYHELIRSWDTLPAFPYIHVMTTDRAAVTMLERRGRWPSYSSPIRCLSFSSTSPLP